MATNWAAAVRSSYAVTLGLHQRRIAMAGVECRVLSLDSVESIAAAIRQANAAIVVHSAAMTNVDACEEAHEYAVHVNTNIARNVALACRSEGAKLVHVSTDHVFSGINSMMDEGDIVEPINIYAQTKAAGEVAVMDACPNAIVARTNFFGWGLPYRKSFSDSIVEQLRAGREIGLFQDAYFTPILMNLLVKAAHELVDSNVEGVFHVAGDERVSKYEFGLSIARVFGLDAELIKPTRLAERHDLVPRPRDLSLDNTKMRTVIGHSVGDMNSQVLQLLANEGHKPDIKVIE